MDLLFLGGLGTTEVIVILLVVLLLFGGRKIPELMRGLGKGIREFNDAKSNVRKEIEDGISEKERGTATPVSTAATTASTTPVTSTTQP